MASFGTQRSKGVGEKQSDIDDMVAQWRAGDDLGGSFAIGGMVAGRDLGELAVVGEATGDEATEMVAGSGEIRGNGVDGLRNSRTMAAIHRDRGVSGDDVGRRYGETGGVCLASGEYGTGDRSGRNRGSL